MAPIVMWALIELGFGIGLPQFLLVLLVSRVLFGPDWLELGLSKLQDWWHSGGGSGFGFAT